MQYLAILGRQPKLSLAELESLFSDVVYLGKKLATFSSDTEPDIARLGGTVKVARPLTGKASTRPELFLENCGFNGKFVIGVSDFSKNASARSAQGEALRIKRLLKKRGFSVRVLANGAAEHSSATVFHNQLGEKPGHFELIKIDNMWFVGLGVQNINAYARRDQSRPARDAKNGMLPPKLAQILINLAGPLPAGATILDPFCGTGVVLQEALLMGYRAYGTDKSDRIVGFARKNLEWLVGEAGEGANVFSVSLSSRDSFFLETADATDHVWRQPIDAVVFEGYLGPPMSQIPAAIKMKSVISDLLPLYYHTLRNLSSQIKPNVPVVMAIPAWLRPDGSYQRLNLLDEIDSLGYNVEKYKNLGSSDMLYFREGQVVAREIIVLRKK